MGLPGMSSPRRATRRRAALWSALTMGLIAPSIGCQVEYAGMTLPSGKYMHDDVQYFSSGPEFPFARTQAASQRARMRAMGMEVPTEAPITTQRPFEGAVEPIQRQFGSPTDVNASPLQDVPRAPEPGIPENAPPPGAVPPPPGFE